jgi:hypothetical protein
LSGDGETEFQSVGFKSGIRNSAKPDFLQRQGDHLNGLYQSTDRFNVRKTPVTTLYNKDLDMEKRMIQSNTNKVLGNVNLRCTTSKGTKPIKSQYNFAHEGPIDNHKGMDLSSLCNDSSAAIEMDVTQLSGVCPAIHDRDKKGFKSLQQQVDDLVKNDTMKNDVIFLKTKLTRADRS